MGQESPPHPNTHTMRQFIYTIDPDAQTVTVHGHTGFLSAAGDAIMLGLKKQGLHAFAMFQGARLPRFVDGVQTCEGGTAYEELLAAGYPNLEV